MDEGKQRTLPSMTNAPSKYPRTSIDKWIDLCAILGLVCSLLFMILAITTSSFIFLMWMLGVGAIAWAVWFWWHMFRQAAWDVHEYARKRQKDLSTAKTKYILIGIGLMLVGVLVTTITSNLHYWWLSLLTGPIGCVSICYGIAFIIQVVKPKAERRS